MVVVDVEVWGCGPCQVNWGRIDRAGMSWEVGEWDGEMVGLREVHVCLCARGGWW